MHGTVVYKGGGKVNRTNNKHQNLIHVYSCVISLIRRTKTCDNDSVSSERLYVLLFCTFAYIFVVMGSFRILWDNRSIFEDLQQLID